MKSANNDSRRWHRYGMRLIDGAMPSRGVLCGLGAAALFWSAATGGTYLSAGLGLDSTTLLPCQDAIQRESHRRKADASYLVGIVAVEKNDSNSRIPKRL
jgi:hypothetical protein